MYPPINESPVFFPVITSYYLLSKLLVIITAKNEYLYKVTNICFIQTAFQALCQSTHLYGRRLVLEWADQNDESEDVNLLRKRTAQSFNVKTPGGKKSRKGAIDSETFVDSNKYN